MNSDEESSEHVEVEGKWGMVRHLVPKPTEFRHRALYHDDEIRILVLQPGQYDSELSGHLIHERLSAVKRTKFYALSYHWGDHLPTEKIRINNRAIGRTTFPNVVEDSRRSTFMIRPNLLAALKRIRHEDDEIALWTDAICINQDKKDEVSRQVERMGEVYLAAHEVFVWLGNGTSRQMEENTFDDLRRMLDLHGLERMVTREESDWNRIVNLMSVEWFSRRWVIQELALARSATVHFGTAKMPWSEFSQAVALFIKKFDAISPILTRKLNQTTYAVCHPEMSPSGANLLVDLTTHLFRRDPRQRILQKRLTLEFLVSTLLPYRARDPRDTIYALLGIARDTSGEGVTPTESLDERLKPDYRKPILDVCAGFMHYCIESSRSLDILCRNWAPLPSDLPGLSLSQRLRQAMNGVPPSPESLPSWLPSLQQSPWGTPGEDKAGRKNADSLVGVSNRQSYQHYCASAELDPDIHFGKTVIEIAKQPPDEHDPPPADGKKKSKKKKRKRKKRAREEDEPTRPESHPSKKQKRDNSSETMEAGPSDASQHPSPTSPGLSEPNQGKYDNVLRVKGIVVGSITKLSQRAASANIDEETLRMFGYNTMARKENRASEMEYFEDFWRTLVADRGPNGVNIYSWYAAACKEVLTSFEAGRGFIDTSFLLHNSANSPPLMKEFLKRVEAVIWGRRFIKMTPWSHPKDHDQPRRPDCFGLVPGGSKKKDIVCVLFGCSVPVVLRKDSSGSDQYKFIGECYVQGIMDGEAIQEARERHNGRSSEISGSRFFELV